MMAEYLEIGKKTVPAYHLQYIHFLYLDREVRG